MPGRTRRDIRFGPYFRPRFRPGQEVVCQVRGPVRIVRLSNGPLQWPIGEKDGQQELIVYKSLFDAIRKEHAEAIAARWGIPVETAAGWQQTLGFAPVSILVKQGLFWIARRLFYDAFVTREAFWIALACSAAAIVLAACVRSLILQ